MASFPNRGTASSPFTRRSDERWRIYSQRKIAWIREHPEATWQQIEKASKAIARELKL